MTALVLCPVKGKAPYPPLAICSLKAWLKKNEISSTAIDLNNKLKNINSSLFNKIDSYFGRPKTYLNTENIEEFFNIDTIYNFRLLLHLICFEKSNENKLTEDELFFYHELNEQIESDALGLISSGFKYIGFSTYVSNICYSILLSVKLKKLNSNIKIFYGGSSTAYKPIRDFLLNLNIADYVLVGEGENAIVKLIRDISCNTANYNTIYSENIAPSTITKREITVPIIQDINELPFPDFSDFNLDNYSLAFSKKHRFVTIASSRGCVNRCAYCSETQYWFRYRQRNVTNVIQEIDFQQNKNNASLFFFCDSLINGNVPWLIDFCNNIISKKLNILWMSYATINNLNRNLLQLMAKSGCVSLTLGIEHISPTVLKGVNKVSSIGNVKKTLLDCLDAGIFPIANIIYALPNEKDNDFLELLYFVSDMELKGKVLFTFRPYEIRVGSVVTQNLIDSSKSFFSHDIPFSSTNEQAISAVKELSKYWLPEEQYVITTKKKQALLSILQENYNENYILKMENIRKYNISPILKRIISDNAIPTILIKSNYRNSGFQNYLLKLINGKNSVSKISKAADSIILKERPNLSIDEIHEVSLRFVIKNLIDLSLKHQIIWN